MLNPRVVSGESWGFAGWLLVGCGERVGCPVMERWAFVPFYSSDFFSAGAVRVDVAEECLPDVVLW